jgi:hypothetical protein
VRLRRSAYPGALVGADTRDRREPLTLRGMARPAPPRQSILSRLLIGVLLLILLWFVLSTVVGLVWSIIRAALFLALFAVVAWVVLVGRPGRPD